MRSSDPFAPLSQRKKLGYAIAIVVILVVAAVILGSMNDGFSAWDLLRGTCIVGIPAFAMLGVTAWLSGGKRSEVGAGSANVRLPLRFLRALPYMAGIIALFYVVKAIDAFQSR